MLGSSTNSGLFVRNREADRERLRAIHARLTGGDLAGAAAMATRAVAEGIEHPMVLSLAAGRLEDAARPADALPLLLRAKALAPAAPGILNALGLCLQRLDRFAEAVAEFDAALAADPGFVPALANRGASLVALSRLVEAKKDFEQALALDPANLIAMSGLAALAIRRGDPAAARAFAARVLAREPGFPQSVMALAGADLADGRPAEAERDLRALIGDSRVVPPDRALALGRLGDALDAQRRFGAAFAAWQESNQALAAIHRAEFAGGGRTLALVRDIAESLQAAKLSRGAALPGPARRHVFLAGFPRSGTTLIEQALEQHPDVTTLAEKECLTEAVRAFMTDRARFERFRRLPDAELEPVRATYWRRVAEEGAEAQGKVFVDKHPFHSFKLPLIARLFPDALILFARRDPRDTVLSCFRHHFRMSEPVHQLLTLGGAAELYAATMDLASKTFAAFAIDPILCPLETLIADFDGETKKICAALGIEWSERLGDFAADAANRGVFTPSAPQLARGLNAEGIGKWRDYAQEMTPALPALAPWVERFGYD
jgi:tetratricopeptide (TPR) repeat protein